VQVSRLGQPLVNEVVVPSGLKDAFNSLTPDKDATIPAVVARVTDPEVPKLIEAIYKVPAPATPRNDLVEIFLTGITTKNNGPIKADLNSQLNNMDVNPAQFQPSEMLRLNLTVPVAQKPERLGVLAGDLQGFPNGRRLTDDVVDIGLQALEGAAQTGKLVDAIAAGDKVDANDNQFSGTFPYVALPNGVGVNTLDNGNGTGIPPVMTPSPATSAQPSSLTGNDGVWMTPAIVTASGAVLLGAGAMVWALWWRPRRRQALATAVPENETTS
jgi:hypothetical protein